MSCSDLGEFIEGIEKRPGDTCRPPSGTFDLRDEFEQYEVGDYNRSEFPDLEGFDWEAAIVSYGPIDAVEYWQLTSRPSWDSDFNPENIPVDGAVVLNGLEAYIEEFGLRVIEHPDAYTRFEGEDTVFRWSADSRTHLQWQDLKRCVRLANGSGRINTQDTQLVLGEHGVIVITGPRGAFIARIPRKPMFDEELPDPPEPVYQDVAGIEIPEEHPDLREGFKRLVELTAEHDIPSPISYRGLNGSHVVETTSGEAEITANGLRVLFGQQQSPAECAGEYSEYCDGADYVVTVTESDFPYQVNEFTKISNSDLLGDDSPFDEREIEGVVGGYRLDWKKRDHISATSTSTRKLELVASTSVITPELDVRLVRFPLREFDP